MNMKITALCLAILCLLPHRAAAQTADEVVAKALAARGGVSRIKAVQSQRISGTISFGAGADGPFVVELKRPGKMRIEVTLQGQTLIRTFDGKSSGWILNPFGESKDVQPMSAEDLRNIADESDFDGPLVDYLSKGSTLQLAGKQDIEGKPAYRLNLTNKQGQARSYYFDAASYLLLKWEGSRTVGDKSVPWESLFRDYREVNGLQMAFEIDSDAIGTEQSQKIIVSKLEIDAPIEESRFEKPVAPPPASLPAGNTGDTSAPPSNPPNQ